MNIEPGEYSILLCDDEESIRDLLRHAIMEWGFKVDVFSCAEDALDFIAQGHAPHIVLSDIHMSGMTGIELAEEVKKISQNIEVIIMTALGSLDTAIRAMRIGVFDYLCKPFEDVDDIRTALFHVCERIHMRTWNQILVSELTRRNEEIASLAQMSSQLAQTLDVARVLQIGCEGLSAGLGGGPVAFYQYRPAQRVLVAAASHPDGLFGDARPAVPVPENSARDIASLKLYLQNLQHVPAFLDHLQRLHAAVGGTHPSSAQGRWRSAEFLTRDTPRGLFVFHVRHWDETESHARIGRHLHTLSMAYENALNHARLLETSLRDGLTELYNIQHLRARLQSEIESATRLRHPVSILFCDVDHFKKYNDQHGHPAGDEVLRQFAGLMLRSFGATDVCARYGGEEFCVLMPSTALADALVRAERFRAEVETTRFPHEETQPLGRLTISVGVAELPTHAATGDSLIEAADVALYAAKKRSRNVVVRGSAPEGYVQPYVSGDVRSTQWPAAAGGSPDQPHRDAAGNALTGQDPFKVAS